MITFSRFYPTKPGNCITWLDAGKGVTLDGSYVTAWTDLSGQGNTADGTWAPPSYATDALNGRPGVIFDGNHFFYFFNRLNLFNNLSGVSIFAVCSSSSTSDFQTIFFASTADNGGDKSRVLFAINDSYTSTTGYEIGTFKTVFSPGDYLYLATNSANNTNNNIVTSTMDFQANTAVIYINGTQSAYSDSFGTSGNITNTDSLYMCLGTLNWSCSYIGNIYEIIIYSNSVSVDIRKTVEQYLSRKYNITVS